MAKKISRRKFFIRGGLGTIGVLAIGTYVFRNPLRRSMIGAVESLPPTYQGSGTQASLWFELTKENQLIFHSPKVEMGQGSFTSFAQMIAEEMDLRIDQIKVIGAETSTGVVDNLSTGGSLSVGGLWNPLRELSATMKEMLKIEASRKLEVDIAELSTENGVVSGGGKTLTYAEVADGVSEWTEPENIALKEPKDFKFIGKPLPRIDLESKVYGEPIFGLDAEMPGMVYATVIRPEVIGATVESFDTSKAENMPGVVAITKINDWLAIMAKSYPEAIKARNRVDVNWNIPKKWSEEELRGMLQVGKGDEMVTQKVGSALSDNDEIETLEFTSPIGAHAQLEPNAAVAEFDGKKATVILSTQVIGVTQKQIAEALKLEPENVNIIPTYLGGGFGRRLNTSHAVQACLMSQAVGKPVKYIFSRKEEFQNDTFRPPTHHVMKGKLGSDGYLESLEHHYASGDVAVNSVIVPGALHTILGTDVGAMRGGNIMYDSIPNHRAVQWHKTLPFATSWWRSLGLLANTFAIESFVDEMALKAGKNPVDFRVKRLGNSTISNRIRNVIETAAEKANYTDEVSGGMAMGIAASIDGNSPAAHVVEVSIEKNQIKVNKVVCVLDCGVAVNPDQVKAQCEGSIIMGISAAMFEKMHLKDGKLGPTIYGPYQMALLRHSPKDIEVHLIQGADIPLPVGEPPLGPIAAAVGNAVKRLTGKRITDLPLSIS